MFNSINIALFLILGEILKSNDNVVKVMGQYKRLVEDSGEEVGLIDSTQAGAPLVKAPVGNGLGKGNHYVLFETE